MSLEFCLVATICEMSEPLGNAARPGGALMAMKTESWEDDTADIVPPLCPLTHNDPTCNRTPEPSSKYTRKTKYVPHLLDTVLIQSGLEQLRSYLFGIQKVEYFSQAVAQRRFAFLMTRFLFSVDPP